MALALHRLISLLTLVAQYAPKLQPFISYRIFVRHCSGPGWVARGMVPYPVLSKRPRDTWFARTLGINSHHAAIFRSTSRARSDADVPGVADGFLQRRRLLYSITVFF